jgi:hypothetical protein
LRRAARDGGQFEDRIKPSLVARGVGADSAYRSAANLNRLDRRGLVPQFQQTKPRGKPMQAHVARREAQRGRIRARVDKHVFAAQKRRFNVVIRIIGRAHATTKITRADLAHTMRRLTWLDGKAVPAWGAPPALGCAGPVKPATPPSAKIPQPHRLGNQASQPSPAPVMRGVRTRRQRWGVCAVGLRAVSGASRCALWPFEDNDNHSQTERWRINRLLAAQWADEGRGFPSLRPTGAGFRAHDG